MPQQRKSSLAPKHVHPPVSDPKRRIGLVFAQGVSFAEKVRHGIVDYAQAHGGWNFTVMPEMLAPSVGWLRYARIDGALAMVTSKRDMRLARSLHIPLINLTAHVDPSPVPSVMVDHKRIGEIAAAFLIERGFSRLAYYGTNNMWYSRQRHAGFSAIARRSGVQCGTHMQKFPNTYASQWRDEHRALLQWLRGLRPPVGILASIDMRAAMVVDACAELGLRVPEDVAVIGVDNDHVVCELGTVPITSVSRNDWQVGWEAAAMLDRLMRGEPAPPAPLFIAPDKIVERKSTDTFAADDEVVSGLLADMRQNLAKPFGVEWLVKRSGYSRRWLELRFRETLGQSPHEVINRLRIDKARDLLAGSERTTLTDVAARCGFSDARRFRMVFLQKTGMLPRKFRNEQQTRAKR